MPLYDFYCKNCGFELNDHRMTLKESADLVYCPICKEVMNKNYAKMLPAHHDVPIDSVEFDMPGKPFVYHTRGQLKAEAKRRGLEVDLGLRSRERYGK